MAQRVSPLEVRAAMQADRDAGMSVKQIAKKYGWSRQLVEARTTGVSKYVVTESVAAAMQADRDAGLTVTQIAENHGWSEVTVITWTTGPRCRQKPNLARYRRIVAANASPEADREAIAARFGLANRNVLSATVSKGRRFLAEAGRPTP